MEPFGRQPPRYVPTLTDVVAEGLPIRRPAEAASDVPRHMDFPTSGPVPDGLGRETVPPEPWPTQTLAPAVADAAQLHEEVVARLLERVQPMLEAQLREALDEVMQSHADLLVRSLRVAAEDVLRAAVADAIVQELQK